MRSKGKDRNIFIAGAAGFIGQRVCRLLSEQGYRVHSLIFSDIEWERVERYSAKCIKGDLLLFSDTDSIQRYLRREKISSVIFMVGSVDYRQEYEASKRINIDTTRNMIEMCLPLYKSGLLHRFIYLGSVASRGFVEVEPPRDEWINEKRSYFRRGLSVYCDVKHDAEEMVRNSGLPAIILEPGSLVGKEMNGASTTNVKLIRRIMKGMPVLGGGASYSSVEAVVKGISLAIEQGTIGETYLLGGENMTMKDFAVLVRRVAEERFPKMGKISLPVLSLPESIASMLGSMHIMVNAQQALLGSSFHYIDWHKAETDLGYSHSMAELEGEIENVLRDMRP